MSNTNAFVKRIVQKFTVLLQSFWKKIMNTISSAELFAMQLPCLPKSKQGIEYQAKKGCWAFV
ncbi:hypothetical protein BWP33_03115 [Simonsiella muelleri ATCC 29453]|nr:hypothetical protein BWP33_03115 [Simonsiella muelleri ATCC 29453]